MGSPSCCSVGGCWAGSFDSSSSDSDDYDDDEEEEDEEEDFLAAYFFGLSLRLISLGGAVGFLVMGAWGTTFSSSMTAA